MVSLGRSLGIASSGEEVGNFLCMLSSAGSLMFNVNLGILCPELCSLLSPRSVVKFRS